MSELFWAQARKCPACASHKYFMIEADGGAVVECKLCQHRRGLQCPICQSHSFEIREKRDGLDRPYRRPYCMGCGETNTSWNLRLAAES
jgi:hypothetical protein